MFLTSIICEIVYAEIAPAFDSPQSLDQRLERLGITISSLDRGAAWEAGISFRRYRQSGGPKEHLIPDFLIAGHAMVHADRLAATDRGYLRRWFSDLKLLAPVDDGRTNGNIAS